MAGSSGEGEDSYEVTGLASRVFSNVLACDPVIVLMGICAKASAVLVCKCSGSRGVLGIIVSYKNWKQAT